MAEKAKNPSVGEGLLGKNKDLVGSYQEAPGGGTPLPAGTKAPSKEWVAENRKMQPRDENGQFTYNSANAKPLKYGPSRGTTIPPFLRGVELSYAVKAKSVIIGEDMKRYLAGINMTKDQLIDSYKEFTGEGFKNLQDSMKKKVGAKSKVEKAAIEKGTQGLITKITYEQWKNESLKAQEISKSKKAEYGKFTTGYASKKKAEQPSAPKAEPKLSVKPDNEPKIEPKQTETKKYGQLGEGEQKMAKEDAKGFVSKYSNELKNVINVAGEKGYDVSLKQLVGAISQGEFTSWDDLIEKIKNAEG